MRGCLYMEDQDIRTLTLVNIFDRLMREEQIAYQKTFKLKTSNRGSIKHQFLVCGVS